MKVKTYAVLQRAVEEGVGIGWRHAHKHVDAPDEIDVLDSIEAGVMNSICEWFDFDDDADDETHEEVELARKGEYVSSEEMKQELATKERLDRLEKTVKFMEAQILKQVNRELEAWHAKY